MNRSLSQRLLVIGLVLRTANVGAWAWALVTAMMAYGFGLRHAIDADHIAAIDNVTPKIDAREGKRPVAGGFFLLTRPLIRLAARSDA